MVSCGSKYSAAVQKTDTVLHMIWFRGCFAGGVMYQPSHILPPGRRISITHAKNCWTLDTSENNTVPPVALSNSDIV